MVKFTAYNDIDTINRILDVSSVGLWEIRIDIKTNVASMYCNDYMLQLLELETHLPPKECYMWWYNRIDDAFKAYVNTTLEKTIQGYVDATLEKTIEVCLPEGKGKKAMLRLFLKLNILGMV